MCNLIGETIFDKVMLKHLVYIYIYVKTSDILK